MQRKMFGTEAKPAVSVLCCRLECSVVPLPEWCSSTWWRRVRRCRTTSTQSDDSRVVSAYTRAMST